MAPCVIFEDEHLLVVYKPAGWNTHAPGPFAGEGIYDWLRAREPRWSSLAIIHRLDKETSGVMVFGKTPLANRSLTEQFSRRRVRKKYLLLTDRPIPQKVFTVKTSLRRTGEKYASGPGGELAETKFIPVKSTAIEINRAGLRMVEAEPLTGRTHQIRVHAAESGFPILGDTLYGGTASSRVFLHAGEIEFAHPATNKPVTFSAPTCFGFESERESRKLQAGSYTLRSAIIDLETTNAFRLIHGASDGKPGWFVDKLGDFLLSQSESPLTAMQNEELLRLVKTFAAHGVYHKTLSRQVRRSNPTDVSPHLVFGEPAPEQFEILENNVRYEMSFNEGYSVGLFLDQRDNRRRFLTGHVAANFSSPFTTGYHLLNCFAYTCAFSVCAAKAGALTTSLDLSKKYLDWGRRNFALNGLDPEKHDFIYGDVFDWLRRLAKKDRIFDAVVLDPPTFSQSRQSGVFRVEKNFTDLVTAALRVLKPGGTLFASTNAADWPAEKFLAAVESSVHAARRKIMAQHYIPQPPDFPVSRSEPAYLKTLWLKVD
ncbi:MAG TPA: pseudouridine synthase [Verrucomicrobiae bacterium]|nr:pseudouridine synthase [Verrucomicrobiae bacterium]